MLQKLYRTLAVAVALAAIGGAPVHAHAKFNVTKFKKLTAKNNKVTVTAQAPTLLKAIDASYLSAFNAWNNALPVAQQLNAPVFANAGNGLSDKAKLSVTQYEAFTSGTLGGVKITVEYTPGNGDPAGIAAANGSPAAGEAVWTQSITTTLAGNPIAPIVVNGGNSTYLDYPQGLAGAAAPTPGVVLPLYPYQYKKSKFFDGPSRPATNTWTGFAFIGTLVGKTLTIYDGVTYGFSVAPTPRVQATPETGGGVVLLMAGGLLFALVSRKRRAGLSAAA